MMVKPTHAVTAVSLPGADGIGHQWPCLPDVASTLVQLVERCDSLGVFAAFHMAGHWNADGRQMAEAIRRELREMRYLWKTTVRLRNARLAAVLGVEPHKPLDDAVGATQEGVGGCSGNKQS